MTQKKKKEGILASFLEYFYGNFVVLLLGFISIPLITRVMSTAEYGRTEMFTSAVSIIYIFAILGLDQSYIRNYYTEGVNRKTLLLQCLKYPVILILILSAIYIIFAETFNQFLFGRNSADVIFLVVLYTVTSVFERFMFLNIRMDQNGKLYSNLNILSKVLYIVFIFIFLYILGDDYRVVMYALTLPLVIVTLFCIFRYAYITRSEKATAHAITSRELLTYGIPFIPMLLMEWLLSSMDKWSIKIFNDFSETGIYAVAMRIMTLLLTFKITYVAFWSPVAMEKYEKEEDSVCKAFFADMFEKVQFLCMAAAFLLTTFRWLIVLIIGEEYRDAIRIIPFLSLMPVLSILFEMTGQGVKFVKKIKYFNYASFVAIIFNLTGNSMLVPQLKGVGAALATAITYIAYFCIGTYFSVKCYPVKYNFKRFTVSLVIYMAYATYATFTTNQLVSAGIGIVLLLIHCLVNKKVLFTLLGYAKEMLSKLR